MANPSVIFADTDALNQVLLGNTLRILRELKVQYGIQTIVVPEVEMELLSSRRFGQRFHSPFKKAVSNGLIKVFEESRYSAILTSLRAEQPSALGVSYADIQALGNAFHRRIDLGEAYTLAAAVKLNQPALSNDYSALKTMQQAGLQVPITVLRAYDLIVFAHQVGILDERQCEEFRQTMVTENEFVPARQKSTSFAKGLPDFVPRLIDRSRPSASAKRFEDPPPFASPLLVTPLKADAPSDS